MMIIVLICTLAFSCKKNSNDPLPVPEPPVPAKKIKVKYEIISVADPFYSYGNNKIMYTGTDNGFYSFDTLANKTWKKEITFTQQKAVTLSLYADIVLKGENPVVTGNIYVDDVLKATALGTLPYFNTDHTQMKVDVKYTQ
ncbi:hypothetical protein [Pedobacter jeongneungensis]